MARCLGHVVHNQTIVGYFEYDGYCDRAETVIYPTENIDIRSGRLATCTCNMPATKVQLWSEYGGGFWWPSEACLACQAITGERYSLEFDNDGHPLGPEFETEWARLCNQ